MPRAPTRQNPADPDDIRSQPMWVRSACPHDLTRSRNVWVPIARGSYSNEDLLREAESVPRHTPEELAG